VLDTDTKKQIDSCRDILVGKLPDPKSQVEQITIALIYKFMDDMDKEAEEWKGKPTFFTGDFEKYAWHKIFDPRISSFDMLNLYSEAIQKMNQNPKIPQLFRDIFKNAYLPYRDPETLKSFLKEINTFHYSHSEKLGDAFEYLLSVLGSQGDAGQFRTPRHLIDFMAEIVAPQKGETILDPACGTAGFLVAAYKYIMKTNMDKRPGDLLSPDDRKRFVENFTGYDISPDMVRLSLVNLYLHGFSEPHVYEYDTLTSEDHWGEGYDIVLANPPFMSPKGGIKPHKRFAIQAKRSEVLFVDYIAEHLNPQGRAAVIVPEGIIFQTQTAYKDLRKMLLNSYLWGVISLPAGVFQPYSGVKTSILLMDKRLVKRTENVIFLKLDNDGYGLGAQRREIELNDIPAALEILNAYKSALFSGETYEISEQYQTLAHIITKSKIAEKGDYILSGERYRITNDELKIKNYELVELGEVLEYEQPTNYIVESIDYKDEYKIPVLTAGKSFILGFTNETEGIFDKNKLPVIIFDDFTTATKFVDFPFKVKSSAMKILHAKKEKANIKYLFYTIQNINFDVNEHKRFWISEYSKLKIPLPPLTIQEQIVSEIENYQKIIDGAKQIVENWKPQIKIKEEWEVKELGEVATFKNGINYTKESNGNLVRILGVRDFKDNLYAPLESFDTVQIDGILDENYKLKKGDIVFVRSNGNQDLIGRCVLISELNFDATFSGFTIRLRFNSNEYESKFFTYLFKSDLIRKKLVDSGTGANIKSLNQTALNNLLIPVPPLSEQESIVKAIEEERTIVESNKRLIEIFEQKIKNKIAEVWGE